MIIGLGCDLIEVARIAQKLLADPALCADIFSPSEIEYCNGRRYPARHYAARFAAKEALFKALGTGLQAGMTWRDVEVLNEANGAPVLHLSGMSAEMAAQRGVRRILLSLSHTEHYGTATVLLES